MKTEKINDILTRGVENIIEKENLLKKLKSGKQLRIKHGIDPTASDLHLGNAVVLWKLREFQKLGHKIIFIIGDFTAKIGDPSGRLSERKPLSEEEIMENMKNYKEQMGTILDMEKTEIIYNSRHLSKLSFAEIYRMAHFFSVNQLFERDMFQERKKMGRPIWLHEFFYPVFQAYDSVVVKADVEIGGSDQLFNMMMGRQLQPHFNQSPQDILTTKLLIGTDGTKKMSKSFGNYIGIKESPNEQYGKIMSIKDELILEYFELATFFSLEEIKRIETDIKSKKTNPRDAKARLAFEIVSVYHGKPAAQKAEEEFKKVFKNKETPSKMPEIKIPEKELSIVDLLVKVGLAPSKSEGRRLIAQGGVKINGKVQKDAKQSIKIEKGAIIQVGSRRFAKIIN